MRLRHNLRTLPPAAWVLLGGTFINRFGTFVVPFLVLSLTRNGYSIAQAGLGVGAYGAGHVMASMLGGHLADRVGRRKTIVASMFGSAAAMLALSQARTFGPILLLACLAGTAAEMYRPAANALMVDLVGRENSVFAFGMYRFAVNLAFAAGPATAGFLADHSFLYLFVGDAATSIAYGIIAIVALPHGLRSDMRGERAGEAVRLAAANRPFLMLLAATILLTLVDFQLGSTFALHVKALGFPPLSTATGDRPRILSGRHWLRAHGHRAYDSRACGDRRRMDVWRDVQLADGRRLRRPDRPGKVSRPLHGTAHRLVVIRDAARAASRDMDLRE